MALRPNGFTLGLPIFAHAIQLLLPLFVVGVEEGVAQVAQVAALDVAVGVVDFAVEVEAFVDGWNVILPIHLSFVFQ